MASENSENSSGSVQTSDVTTITINPNISGSGIGYTVYGVGSPGHNVVASGSALTGPVTVKVSGYDRYTVDFGGGTCIFGNEVTIKSGLTANVTLAVTITQG